MTGAVLPHMHCIAPAGVPSRRALALPESGHPIAQRELLSYVHNDVIAAPGLDHGPPRLQAFPTKGHKEAHGSARRIYRDAAKLVSCKCAYYECR